MKGIIFVTWEKYLQDRFGPSFLRGYHDALGETHEQLPRINRIYPDEMLISGLKIATSMSSLSEDRLMFEYGHYFIINGLTGYLCSYLLSQVDTGYRLLLLMRAAHNNMGQGQDDILPPLFTYDIISEADQHLIVTYDSSRHLCSLMKGAIHGAAERFGEQVSLRETTCMKIGDDVCSLEVQFYEDPLLKGIVPVQQERSRSPRQDLTDLILQVLPSNPNEAVTMDAISHAVDRLRINTEVVHVSQVYTVLAKLRDAGFVASTASIPGDTFMNRQYWLAPKDD